MAEGAALNIPVTFGDAGPIPMDFNFTDPPAGPWEVEILSFEEHTSKKDTKCLKYGVSIVDKDAEGIAFDIYMGLDWTKKGNTGHLANLLHGLHKGEKYLSAEKLKGIKAINAGMFVGMRAHVNVKPAPEGEIDENGRPKLADRNFCSRDQFLAYKKAAELAAKNPRPAPVRASPTPAAPAANGAAAAAPAAPAAPPAAAAAEVGDLFGEAS